jgi:hypothetical protein
MHGTENLNLKVMINNNNNDNNNYIFLLLAHRKVCLCSKLQNLTACIENHFRLIRIYM